MSYKNKYIDKGEIVSWIQIQNEDLTEEDIPDDFMNKGHTKTDAELVLKKCLTIPTKNDDLDFLKMATQCFILALLAKAGLITQTSGELLTNKFGDVMYQFQRTNPMFFFATGASEPFMDLLPYETLRMYGLSFIKAYVKYKFYETYGKVAPTPKLSRDPSSRGAYWNDPIESADVADARYGDTLPAEEDY
jgi:hypothetical protein